MNRDTSTSKVLMTTLAVLGLGLFFAWALVQMASASDSMVRLAKLGAGTLVLVVAVPLVYAATGPLRERRRD